eukprot:TRINITY_DN10271_c0_g1_i3.p2 TRINITY_DN10271_c0_g1~~TRINITY_DN10271_c0_g1_i3.p2  ORF type:complete len:230 (+),score=-17.14 TRINITY_DN10271_c0_g1_i3:251-940(+)
MKNTPITSTQQNPPEDSKTFNRRCLKQNNQKTGYGYFNTILIRVLIFILKIPQKSQYVKMRRIYIDALNIEILSKELRIRLVKGFYTSIFSLLNHVRNSLLLSQNLRNFQPSGWKHQFQRKNKEIKVRPNIFPSVPSLKPHVQRQLYQKTYSKYQKNECNKSRAHYFIISYKCTTNILYNNNNIICMLLIIFICCQVKTHNQKYFKILNRKFMIPTGTTQKIVIWMQQH